MALGAPARWSRAGWVGWVGWVGTGCRLVLGGVLAVAGAAKVADPAASVRAVAAYQILPPSAAEIVGYGLPFLELALAGLLLVGYATRLAAIAAAGLLVVFLAGVGSAWARGLAIDCGCFGGGGPVAPGATRYVEEIARDVVLLGLAVWLVVRPRTRWSVEGGDAG